MTKRSAIASVAAAGLAAVVFYAAPFQAAPRPLAALFPSGAMLYLEAKNFNRELRAWNGSQPKKSWLDSARFDGFSRSTLYLRLQAEWEQFSTTAAFVPDSALLDSIAGTESGLALYDIGKLQFLYITRLPNARAIQTALWRSRAKYETRNAGGVGFFVRSDNGRTVAFAAAGDYLLLATHEEFLAGALRLLAGEKVAPLQDDGWYKDTAAAAGAPGDVRLVMNLEALVQSAQFRSYWIQRNASEIRNYWAGLSDVRRTNGEIREERVLLRKSAAPAIHGNAAALLRLAPENAAFCRSWVKPDAAQVSGLIEQKMLAPRQSATRAGNEAPTVQIDPGSAGSETDLETRIDEPPLVMQSAVSLSDLRKLLASANLSAVLEVQSGRVLADGVFVDTPTVIAMEAAGPWDRAAVRNALTAAAASLWTTSGSGAGWLEQRRGSRTWSAMEGLGNLRVAAEGNLLLIGNSAEMLAQMLDRIDRPAPGADASAVAIFRHAAARPDYARMTTLLDHAQPTPDAQRSRFFSEDLWSLSEIFAGVRQVELRTRDTGDAVRETIEYR